MSGICCKQSDLELYLLPLLHYDDTLFLDDLLCGFHGRVAPVYVFK